MELTATVTAIMAIMSFSFLAAVILGMPQRLDRVLSVNVGVTVASASRLLCG